MASAAVAAAFAGRVSAESASTSGTGNPLCSFTLASSNSGSGGTVLASLNASVAPSAFQQTKAQTSGAIGVSGVADSAFSVPGTSTVQFLKGRTVVVFQATLRVPGGAAAASSTVQSDLITLARTVAAQL